MGSTFLMPLWGLVALVLMMTWAWKRQRKTGNAGVVDLIWSGSIGVLACIFAIAADGWGPRRLLVGVLVALWSARLTLHLARRVVGEPEDGRYTGLRGKLGSKFDSWIFWFFQAQALLAVLLSLVFLPLMTAPNPEWRLWDVLGLAVWLASIAGESLADRQLRKWRESPDHAGKTCRSGLWAYSRHPNYFFEWIHWLAYPVMGVGLSYGWCLWLAPAAMLILVLKVTGIPPTEEQSLRSRGDDYRAYQRTTNAFFPGPRRRDPGHTLSIS